MTSYAPSGQEADRASRIAGSSSTTTTSPSRERGGGVRRLRLGCGRGCRASGIVDGEARAAAGPGTERERAVEQVGRAAGRWQGPVRGLGSVALGIAELVIFLEHPLLLVGGMPGPVSSTCTATAAPGGGSRSRSAAIGVAHRVGDEIAQNPLDRARDRSTRSPSIVSQTSETPLALASS